MYGKAFSRFEKEQKKVIEVIFFFKLETKSESYSNLNIGKPFLKGIKESPLKKKTYDNMLFQGKVF